MSLKSKLAVIVNKEDKSPLALLTRNKEANAVAIADLIEAVDVLERTNAVKAEIAEQNKELAELREKLGLIG